MTRMRGLNMGGWLSQIDAIEEKDPEKFPGIDKHIEMFIGDGDFANVAQWGFDHVRVPVDSYVFFDDNENVNNSRIKSLDRAVSLAQKHNLKFVLDLHECPGHDFADAGSGPVQKLFSDDDTYIKKAEKIWACLAERYGEQEHVQFETLNEPVAPTADIWNKIKDRLCREIRRHAKKSTIVTGSNMWNVPASFSELTPVDDDNIIYAVHFYEPLLFTHQFAPWIEGDEIRKKRDYPSDYGDGLSRQFGLVNSAGLWNKARLEKEFDAVNTFRKKYNAQVVCNEFGVYTLVDINAQLRWYEDILRTLQEMNIGFSYWNYKNLDFGIISIGEKLHENLPQYQNPERTNYHVLNLLRKY